MHKLFKLALIIIGILFAYAKWIYIGEEPGNLYCLSLILLVIQYHAMHKTEKT